MRSNENDRLRARLACLAVEAPSEFVARAIGLARASAGTDRCAVVHSVLGPLYVVFTDTGIIRSGLELPTSSGARILAARPPAGVVTALRTGRSRGLSFDLGMLTDFERAVLLKTMDIPRGEVRPHEWIAGELGRPEAFVEVGPVLLRNPVPVLIPCHRVVSVDGSIGEYVLGRDAKRILLDHEGANLDEVAAYALRGMRFLGSDTTKIFCHPSCKHARRITPAHRVLFAAADHACADGYRPCLKCRPARSA